MREITIGTGRERLETSSEAIGDAINILEALAEHYRQTEPRAHNGIWVLEEAASELAGWLDATIAEGV